MKLAWTAKSRSTLHVSRFTSYVSRFPSYVLRLTAPASHLWPLLLPVALLLPSLGAFPYPSVDAPYSDLSVAHYPNTLFLKQTLFVERALPLWAPGILSGHPFAANPLSGLWYPPGWLALLLPLPLGFNLLAAAHLLWGGVGMYYLLRAEGLGHPAALLGGLAFEALPKFFAHYGAGHLTLLYAVSWTPWLLLSIEGCRLQAAGSASVLQPAACNLKTWNFFNVKPSIILALIFFADPRWAFYAGVTWCSYKFAHSHFSFGLKTFLSGFKQISHLPQNSKTFNPPGRDLQPLSLNPVPLSSPKFPLSTQISILQPSINILFQTLLTGLLIAPLALPLLELARLSTRAHLASSDIFTYSLPPGRLLGLFFPDFGGFHEWTLYPGVLVFVLGLLGALWGRKGTAGRFWLVVCCASLLFALGEYLPPLTVLGQLPGLDLLRVPSRALFLTGMALAVLAAMAVDCLLNTLSERECRLGRLLLTGLAGFGIILAAGVVVLAGRLLLSFAWGAGFLLISTIWVWLGLRGQEGTSLQRPFLSPRVWFAGVMILCGLDLLVVDHSLFAPHPVDAVLGEGKAVAEFLSAQTSRLGPFRFYSPSYSLPQQTSAYYGLESAGGVDPLQLESYAAYMEDATGVPAKGYSVTLPPFAQGSPAAANAVYRPDPRRLGLLNVRFVLSEYDLPVAGLELRQQFGETRLYENLVARPRAWVQPAGAAPGEGAQAVEITSWAPDRIVLQVAPQVNQDPQLLVLSELAYPGWHVLVDGKAKQILSVAGLLRAVQLEPADRVVVFEFRPASLTLGLVLFGTGIFLIITRWLISQEFRTRI